ncbi:hypothetical protein BDW59DRAFT_105480 [Aspergillus cavernicola]|uniref:Zn(2)-C6 fungal-type domain-containing protein n=1 Tax=Aspergillus cavernicola TaxID=176166 RepID=A0ABR4IXI3_9EURO
MQRVGRKRQVTTCVPCQTRKQKCNRQYPCSHCTWRRRPEDCVYKPTPVAVSSWARSSADETQSQPAEDARALRQQVGVQEMDRPSMAPYEVDGRSNHQHSALAKTFGYFEDSNSNTMALSRNCDLNEGAADISFKGESGDIYKTINQDLERMPHRHVLEFLVQHFV